MKTLDELHSLIDAYAKAVHDGDDYSCMEFKTAIDEALRELIADAERYRVLRSRWVAVAAFETGEYAVPAGMTLCHGVDLDQFADAARKG